jgi:hypothetical protein
MEISSGKHFVLPAKATTPGFLPLFPVRPTIISGIPERYTLIQWCRSNWEKELFTYIYVSSGVKPHRIMSFLRFLK